ncbi:MAG: signal peptidase II [Ruminococcaceae bacterium]|nr:signal peptidase II [Oscillospiraceae bacterium]
MFQAVSLIVIAVLTAVDMFTKHIAATTIKADGPFEFLFGTFQFRYVENTGAAFSSFSDNTVLLTVVTAVILSGCLILLLSKKIKPLFMNICLLLVVAGGTGNLIDRIRFGYVIDFIEPLFIDFAVFNFADCCITVGAIMMIAYEIYELVCEHKKKAVKNG